MHSELSDDPRLPLRGITLGIFATVAWILFAGFFVQHRHAIPSIAEYKGSAANVIVCQAPSVSLVNQCLDDKYAGLMTDWRTEMGVLVVLPPMLLWLAALLHNLGRGLGLFRGSQRA